MPGWLVISTSGSAEEEGEVARARASDIESCGGLGELSAVSGPASVPVAAVVVGDSEPAAEAARTSAAASRGTTISLSASTSGVGVPNSSGVPVAREGSSSTGPPRFLLFCGGGGGMTI